jgi:ferrous iron transport protein A
MKALAMDHDQKQLDHPSTLDTVPYGSSVVVTELGACSRPLLKKLVSMGIVPGSKVTVAQRGAFGSPLNVKLFGSVLSLRKDEAEIIRVSPVVGKEPA